jgi:prolyl-tRNA editing enzyme YbaK/EbsC (Cys-tRNA(Pro) deacylase)
VSNDTPANAITSTRVDAIRAFLEGAGIPYELVEHRPVDTAAAEARAAERPAETVAKTIVLHDGAVYVIAAISAADRLDLHKLRDVLGADRELRLASEEEIARDFPALEVGAIPPFGPMLPAAEVIDSALAARERVLCAAGDHRHSVLVDPREIVRVTGSRIADICEE